MDFDNLPLGDLELPLEDLEWFDFFSEQQNDYESKIEQNNEIGTETFENTLIRHMLPKPYIQGKNTYNSKDYGYSINDNISKESENPELRYKLLLAIKNYHLYHIENINNYQWNISINNINTCSLANIIELQETHSDLKIILIKFNGQFDQNLDLSFVDINSQIPLFNSDAMVIHLNNSLKAFTSDSNLKLYSVKKVLLEWNKNINPVQPVVIGKSNNFNVKKICEKFSDDFVFIDYKSNFIQAALFKTDMLLWSRFLQHNYSRNVEKSTTKNTTQKSIIGRVKLQLQNYINQCPMNMNVNQDIDENTPFDTLRCIIYQSIVKITMNMEDISNFITRSEQWFDKFQDILIKRNEDLWDILKTEGNDLKQSDYMIKDIVTLYLMYIYDLAISDVNIPKIQYKYPKLIPETKKGLETEKPKQLISAGYDQLLTSSDKVKFSEWNMKGRELLFLKGKSIFPEKANLIVLRKKQKFHDMYHFMTLFELHHNLAYESNTLNEKKLIIDPFRIFQLPEIFLDDIEVSWLQSLTRYPNPNFRDKSLLNKLFKTINQNKIYEDYDVDSKLYLRNSKLDKENQSTTYYHFLNNSESYIKIHRHDPLFESNSNKGKMVGYKSCSLQTQLLSREKVDTLNVLTWFDSYKNTNEQLKETILDLKINSFIEIDTIANGSGTNFIIILIHMLFEWIDILETESNYKKLDWIVIRMENLKLQGIQENLFFYYMRKYFQFAICISESIQTFQTFDKISEPLWMSHNRNGFFRYDFVMSDNMTNWSEIQVNENGIEKIDIEMDITEPVLLRPFPKREELWRIFVFMYSDFVFGNILKLPKPSEWIHSDTLIHFIKNFEPSKTSGSKDTIAKESNHVKLFFKQKESFIKYYPNIVSFFLNQELAASTGEKKSSTKLLDILQRKGSTKRGAGNVAIAGDKDALLYNFHEIYQHSVLELKKYYSDYNFSKIEKHLFSITTKNNIEERYKDLWGFMNTRMNDLLHMRFTKFKRYFSNDLMDYIPINTEYKETGIKLDYMIPQLSNAPIQQTFFSKVAEENLSKNQIIKMKMKGLTKLLLSTLSVVDYIKQNIKPEYGAKIFIDSRVLQRLKDLAVPRLNKLLYENNSDFILKILFFQYIIKSIYTVLSEIQQRGLVSFNYDSIRLNLEYVDNFETNKALMINRIGSKVLNEIEKRLEKYEDKKIGNNYQNVNVGMINFNETKIDLKL